MRTDPLLSALSAPPFTHKPSGFVYYQIYQNQLTGVSACVRAMQQRWLALHPGWQAGLMRRPDGRDGLVTLMEIYLPDTVTVSADLLASTLAELDIEATALLQPWLVGTRHTEVFVPCA
jgi:hypothetical protein